MSDRYVVSSFFSSLLNPVWLPLPFPPGKAFVPGLALIARACTHRIIFNVPNGALGDATFGLLVETTVELLAVRIAERPTFPSSGTFLPALHHNVAKEVLPFVNQCSTREVLLVALAVFVRLAEGVMRVQVAPHRPPWSTSVPRTRSPSRRRRP